MFASWPESFDEGCPCLEGGRKPREAQKVGCLVLKKVRRGSINHACLRGAQTKLMRQVVECETRMGCSVDVAQISTVTGGRFILGGIFVIGTGRAMQGDRCISWCQSQEPSRMLRLVWPPRGASPLVPSEMGGPRSQRF